MGKILTCKTIEDYVAMRDDWNSKSTRQGYEALVCQLRAFANFVGAQRGDVFSELGRIGDGNYVWTKDEGNEIGEDKTRGIRRSQEVSTNGAGGERNKDGAQKGDGVGVQGRNGKQGQKISAEKAQEFYRTRVIDAVFFQGFAQFLLRNVKPSTARGYLEKLRALIRQLIRQGVVEEMPLQDISDLFPQSEDAEKVFLTREELRSLRQASCPTESTKQAFLFSCYTGLLKGEVKELQWDNIRYSGTGLTLSRPVENSREMVKVPLIEPAREIISALERDYASIPQAQRDDHVFHLLSNTTISSHLRSWAKEAGIKKNINYMTSRHTFATIALRAGVDLYVVAKWCGYSNVSSAEVYADLVGRNLQTDGDVLEAAFA
ncbi:MAG: tyrosine-type recombinase/integrase [Bacteroidales bacterium]|nr:tyrosine-type recombinase/integrase [Bacteroidales bacterium]